MVFDVPRLTMGTGRQRSNANHRVAIPWRLSTGQPAQCGAAGRMATPGRRPPTEAGDADCRQLWTPPADGGLPARKARIAPCRMIAWLRLIFPLRDPPARWDDCREPG